MKVRSSRNKKRNILHKTQVLQQRTLYYDRFCESDKNITDFETILDELPSRETLTRKQNIKVSERNNDDAKSVITSKDFRGMGLKKKTKMKIRKAMWQKCIKRLKKETIVDKLKKKPLPVIIGDLAPLKNALPTLDFEHITKEKYSSNENKHAKSKSISSQKKMKQQIRTDIELFKNVCDHPAFKKNPIEAISTHLTNKVLQEQYE